MEGVMTKRTAVSFTGFHAPEYPGGMSLSTESPHTPDAVHWTILVGGTQVHLESLEDFTLQVGDFLRLAYEAGRKDKQAELLERLGL